MGMVYTLGWDPCSPNNVSLDIQTPPQKVFKDVLGMFLGPKYLFRGCLDV